MKALIRPRPRRTPAPCPPLMPYRLIPLRSPHGGGYFSEDQEDGAEIICRTRGRPRGAKDAESPETPRRGPRGLKPVRNAIGKPGVIPPRPTAWGGGRPNCSSYSGPLAPPGVEQLVVRALPTILPRILLTRNQAASGIGRGLCAIHELVLFPGAVSFSRAGSAPSVRGVPPNLSPLFQIRIARLGRGSAERHPPAIVNQLAARPPREPRSPRRP